MNGAAAGVVCVVLLIAIPVGLMIAAFILRGGVALANKCIPRPVERDDYGDDEEDWDDMPRRRRYGSRAPVPEPGLGKAMGIVLVRGIIGFIASIPISIAMGVGVAGMGGQPDEKMQILASLIQLPIGFLVNAGMLTVMLPTTFPRACLVAVFEYVIVLGVCLVVVVPLVVLAAVAGGIR